jgi:hypothetical protein
MDKNKKRENFLLNHFTPMALKFSICWQCFFVDLWLGEMMSFLGGFKVAFCLELFKLKK